jgi:uncharacterized protein (TIGR02246 family)
MENAIRETAAALATAISSGDAAGAAALYAADAMLLAPTTELVAGRSQIESYWRTGIALGVSRMELDARELRFASTVAFEIGRYALTLATDRREPLVDLGKYFVLHIQSADGSWRRAVDVFNPDGQCHQIQKEGQ